MSSCILHWPSLAWLHIDRFSGCEDFLGVISSEKITTQPVDRRSILALSRGPVTRLEVSHYLSTTECMST